MDCELYEDLYREESLSLSPISDYEDQEHVNEYNDVDYRDIISTDDVSNASHSVDYEREGTRFEQYSKDRENITCEVKSYRDETREVDGLDAGDAIVWIRNAIVNDSKPDRNRDIERKHNALGRIAERSQDGERIHVSEKSRHVDRTQIRDRSRDSERVRNIERIRESDRRKDQERSRDSDRSKEGERSRDAGRSRDSERIKDIERSRGSEKSRDTRSNYSRDRQNRDRDRNRDRSRDRDRDRHKERRDRNIEDREPDFSDIPNSAIVIRNLPLNITEEDIGKEISKFTLHPQEISVKRRKSTGESRGFAIVEFKLLSEAVRWKELTLGVLVFGQSRSTLHYTVSRDITDRLPNKIDWVCIKCGVHNFRRRGVCFKCNSHKEESEVERSYGEGCEEISDFPSTTLLFRNLDILTTEERVLSMLGQITVLPIKNLKVAKDSLTNTSRGFAYVELHSISEARQLYDLLLSMTGNFYVDGRQVTVSYCRRSLSSLNSVASANAACAALAAAQWTNQNSATGHGNKTMFSASVLQGKQMESVQSLNSRCPAQTTPDISNYQYDETSGYYYDSNTGYYYDPNSQYYYNTITQQYLYWDLEKQAYTIVPTSGSSVISTTAVIDAPASKIDQKEVVITSPPVITHAPVLANKKEEPKAKEKIKPQDKVKIAKKVAKDMEKWAKTLNQKKENTRLSNNNVKKPVGIEETCVEADIPSKSSNVPFYLATPKLADTNLEKNILAMPVGSNNLLGSHLVAAYGNESDGETDMDVQDTSPLDLLKDEESKLIEWDKLACLLCKRQFPSKDILTKHVQISDLHKQNVNMLKLTKLTPKQMQEIEKSESGYRDRAKERRQKFGQPDMPPPNRLKSRYLKERKDAIIPAEKPPEAIGSDNIGNKMLKAMGWTEGKGLGKEGQGMSGIIEVQRRVKSAGLGMKGAAYGATASDSYKDAVRKSMQSRYNEIV